MIYFVCTILAVLIAVSIIRGYSISFLYRLSLPGIKDALIVVRILILIGCLTGLWRCSGTIAYFISFGIGIMPPAYFVLSAFVLTAIMSLAIGTSFGVVATAGVILMSIARAGSVNQIVVAGAIMSGIYIGDRNSPASSSAALTAAITGTEQNRNIGLMLRSSAVPVLFSILIYTALSLRNPMHGFASDSLTILNDNFNLNAVCMLPALVMLILPLLKVKVRLAMFLDIILSFVISVFVQQLTVVEAFKTMIMGYKTGVDELARLLNGGGIISMLNVCVILIVSGSFGGIMKGTGLLDRVGNLTGKINSHFGRFGALTLISVLSCMIFCNQTVGAMMANRLADDLYADDEKYRKMLDLEDTVIVIAGLVPWCIASSVPLATMGVGRQALLFSFFLYLLPIWRLVGGEKLGKRFVKDD